MACIFIDLEYKPMNIYTQSWPLPCVTQNTKVVKYSRIRRLQSIKDQLGDYENSKLSQNQGITTNYKDSTANYNMVVINSLICPLRWSFGEDTNSWKCLLGSGLVRASASLSAAET